MTPEERQFLDDYNWLFAKLPPYTTDDELVEWNTVLSRMLAQASKWGEAKAAQKLRDWADTFGTGPTANGIAAIVREGADRIIEGKEL